MGIREVRGERVEWISFQDRCALIVVRNAVLKSSFTCPGQEIAHRDVDNWVGKKCTVECDDSCPAVPDPIEVYDAEVGEYEVNRWVPEMVRGVALKAHECH